MARRFDQKGKREYGRRALAKMVLDDLLDIRDDLVRTKPALADHHRSGQINTFLKVIEMIGKMVGIDASLLDEDQRRTALEQVQAIFAKPSDQE